MNPFYLALATSRCICYWFLDVGSKYPNGSN